MFWDRNGTVNTSRKRRPAIKEIKKTTQAKMLGRTKGYFFKYSLPPNKPGYCSAGRAKKPPKAGPNTLPTDHTSGMIEKALGCSSLSGTISATIVLMIPTAMY
jgi:hypothetical protein